jgi:hypothetical protein
MATEILRCAQNDRTWFHRNLELLRLGVTAVVSYFRSIPAGLAAGFSSPPGGFLAGNPCIVVAKMQDPVPPIPNCQGGYLDSLPFPDSLHLFVRFMGASDTAIINRQSLPARGAIGSLLPSATIPSKPTPQGR